MLRAWFAGRGFDTHRHDTYAIGVTDAGIQKFDYRGASVASAPGQVVVLHPDEAHDGRAGDANGFGYRIVYVCPMRIFDAVTALSGRQHLLPFLPGAVCNSATMARAVDNAFSDEAVPLACDALILEIARGLLEQVRDTTLPTRSLPIDVSGLERARQYLDAQLHTAVRSPDIEAVSGLNRYECARQFRIRHGTSPYRYSLLRRLEAASRELVQDASIASLAARFGFSDQAHLTRHFRATFGVTPRRYRQLHRKVPPLGPRSMGPQ